MRWASKTATTVVMVSSLLLLAACSNKRADAGLIGSDPVTAITRTGPASLEPVFFSEVTIDRSGRAMLSMQNADGRLPIKAVKAPSGSFEAIAIDLANFRQLGSYARSKCQGISDTGPVTVTWHYASGRVGSYSVMPGCPQPYEGRFLETTASFAKRVGLQTLIDRAPTPQE